MNHLEIEYKTLLTKDEYNRLAVLFSHVTPVTQTNYYIDTPQGDMRNKRLSLRIRTLPTHGELTLKIPEKVGNMEYNVTMDCSEAKAMTKSLDFPIQNSIFAAANIKENNCMSGLFKFR